MTEGYFCMHLLTDINGTVHDASCSSPDCYGWYFDLAQAAVPRIFSRTSQSFLFALTSSGSSIPVAWMSSVLLLSFILCTFKI